jgi:excisionase family DNA binding protein
MSPPAFLLSGVDCQAMRKNTPRAPSRTGQSGQNTTPNRENRDAKQGKPRQVALDVNRESLSPSEAARELGVSLRTLQRFCSDGRLPCFYTPGGQIRVTRTAIEAYRDGSGSGRGGHSFGGSGVIQNKRETIETLNLELQERRARRELRRLEEEDAEPDRRRAAAVQAEEHVRRAELEESRLQRESEAQERERERQRAQWANGWMEYGLKLVPENSPLEVALDVRQAIEEVLDNATPFDPQSLLQRLVLAAVETSLGPWKRQQEIERIVQKAREELPFNLRTYSDWSPPTQWELRAMSAARAAIAQLPGDASIAEVRAVASQSGKRVAMEYETEAARVCNEREQEQERRRRASNKLLLISMGVAEVGPYLRKLHSQDDIFDEDLLRKDGLERAARKAFDTRLHGVVHFSDPEWECASVGFGNDCVCRHVVSSDRNDRHDCNVLATRLFCLDETALRTVDFCRCHVSLSNRLLASFSLADRRC